MSDCYLTVSHLNREWLHITHILFASGGVAHMTEGGNGAASAQLCICEDFRHQAETFELPQPITVPRACIDTTWFPENNTRAFLPTMLKCVQCKVRQSSRNIRRRLMSWHNDPDNTTLFVKTHERTQATVWCPRKGIPLSGAATSFKPARDKLSASWRLRTLALKASAGSNEAFAG
jgi:hypothetical protein